MNAGTCRRYCRKSYDTMEDFYNPRVSAVNFLNTAIKLRAKQTLPTIMQVIAGFLDAYQSTPADQRPEEM